jgi:hypothetical protein
MKRSRLTLLSGLLWFSETLLTSLLFTTILSIGLFYGGVPIESVETLSAPIWLFTTLITFRFTFTALFNRSHNGNRFTTFSCGSIDGKREILEKVEFYNLKNIWRKWLLGTTLWSVIAVVLYLIIKRGLLIESFPFELHILPALFTTIGSTNLMYQLLFNREVTIHRE